MVDIFQGKHQHIDVRQNNVGAFPGFAVNAARFIPATHPSLGTAATRVEAGKMGGMSPPISLTNGPNKTAWLL